MNNNRFVLEKYINIYERRLKISPNQIKDYISIQLIESWTSVAETTATTLLNSNKVSKVKLFYFFNLKRSCLYLAKSTDLNLLKN